MLLAALRPIITNRRRPMPTIAPSAFLAFIAAVDVAGVVAAGPLAPGAAGWIAVGFVVFGVPVGVHVHPDQVKRFSTRP